MKQCATVRTNYDRIFCDWQHLPDIKTVTVTPLKSIYINRSADTNALDLILRSFDEAEDFFDANYLY